MLCDTRSVKSSGTRPAGSHGSPVSWLIAARSRRQATISSDRRNRSYALSRPQDAGHPVVLTRMPPRPDERVRITRARRPAADVAREVVEGVGSSRIRSNAPAGSASSSFAVYAKARPEVAEPGSGVTVVCCPLKAMTIVAGRHPVPSEANETPASCS